MIGFFKKLFGGKEPETENVSIGRANLPEHLPDVARYAENQNGSGEVDFELLVDMLQQMFEDENQFVTLSVSAPVYDGVRFVQACRIPEGIDVQLGIGEGTQTKLVEKVCNEDECSRIFMHFFDTLKVEDISRYTPVRRM